jgi:putative ABC transport system permease protein
VLPEYFQMLGMPLLRGTTFTDTTDAASQAIINEAMVDSLFRGVSPIGRRIRVVYQGDGQWYNIVGIARNAMTRGLTQRSMSPMLYVAGAGGFTTTLLLRTSDPAVVRTVGALVTSIDRNLPSPTVRDIDNAMRKTTAAPRFRMFLLMILAGVAVGLAAVGLYGVLAYTVARRTREIGIRMALGATRGHVATDILRQGLWLAVLGAAAGLVAARFGSKIVSSMLYGVRETDAMSFAIAGVSLMVIAVLACIVPIRRAVRVDPIIAVKAD